MSGFLSHPTIIILIQYIQSTYVPIYPHEFSVIFPVVVLMFYPSNNGVCADSDFHFIHTTTTTTIFCASICVCCWDDATAGSATWYYCCLPSVTGLGGPTHDLARQSSVEFCGRRILRSIARVLLKIYFRQLLSPFVFPDYLASSFVICAIVSRAAHNKHTVSPKY